MSLSKLGSRGNDPFKLGSSYMSVLLSVASWEYMQLISVLEKGYFTIFEIDKIR
jgi:hypothetical protein